MEIILKIAGAAIGVFLVSLWPWQYSTAAQSAAIGGLMGLGAIGGSLAVEWLVSLVDKRKL